VKRARHRRPRVIWFHLYEISKLGKFIDTEIRLVVARGCGEGKMRNSYGASFWGDKNILEPDGGDVCTTSWMH